MKAGRIASFAGKVAVSGTCLGILGARYGRDPELHALFARLDPRAFLLALGLLAFGLVVSALRWKVLLNAAGVRVGMRRATHLVFVGYFFSALLPTSIGGDFVRAVALRDAAPLAVVGGSIVVERLLGFGCLLGLGLAGSWMTQGLAAARPVLLAGAILYAAGVTALVFARVPRVASRAGFLSRALESIRRLVEEVRAFGFHGRALALGATLALGWQLLLVAVHASLASGFGSSAPGAHLAVLVPVVQAVAMIPVSLGGLGIREMGYEYFYRASGFDPAEGLALGLGWLATSMVIAVVGGVWFALRPVARGAK